MQIGTQPKVSLIESACHHAFYSTFIWALEFTLTFCAGSISLQVRQVCITLLPAYPSKRFTVVLLQTLSKLAIATCAQIPSQVCMHHVVFPEQLIMKSANL